MQASISVITLGVADLDRAYAFYHDGLGWPSQGIIGREFEHGAVAFFKLGSGLKLALWPHASMAADSGLPLSAPGALACLLSHNLPSAAAVDQLMSEAQAAGATLTKPAQKTFWGGYAGYFQDPDGHLWEVVYNPDFEALG